MKQCSICKESKPKHEFDKMRRSSDGLQSGCRACSNERKRRWRRNNPEKHQATSSRHMARRQGAVIKAMPSNYRQIVVRFYGGRCLNCKSMHKLEIDHVVALNNGGAHCFENFQLLCKSCNDSKSDRHSNDYRSAKLIDVAVLAEFDALIIAY